MFFGTTPFFFGAGWRWIMSQCYVQPLTGQVNSRGNVLLALVEVNTGRVRTRVPHGMLYVCQTDTCVTAAAGHVMSQEMS